MTITITRETYETRLGVWLAWLRDPSHKQTRGSLRKGGEETASFCCLGGLCEVSQQGSWEANSFGWTWNSGGNSQSNFLSREVTDWIGLKGNAGNFKYNDGLRLSFGVSSLVGLNDSLNWSFEKIAGFIEAHKELLFTWAEESKP